MPLPSFNDMQLSSLRSKPVIIPFDGAYWYFKQPDQRPKGDAPTVRDDPLSKNIRPTNMRPLSMEAHQNLNMSIKVDCCRTLRLAIRNADHEPGAIFVEVLLRDRTLKRPHLDRWKTKWFHRARTLTSHRHVLPLMRSSASPSLPIPGGNGSTR